MAFNVWGAHMRASHAGLRLWSSTGGALKLEAHISSSRLHQAAAKLRQTHNKKQELTFTPKHAEPAGCCHFAHCNATSRAQAPHNCAGYAAVPPVGRMAASALLSGFQPESCV